MMRSAKSSSRWWTDPFRKLLFELFLPQNLCALGVSVVNKILIRKGSIYWVNFSACEDPGNNHRRPGLVIQNDALNNSKLNTVSILVITPTLKFGELPGNVVLKKGEANLSERAVINVTQIKTVNKSSIGDKIGSLSNERMDEVHEGLKLVMNIS